MKRLPKPTAEQVRLLKEEIMVSRQISVAETERLLSRSCGDSVGAVQKRMLPMKSKQRRDTPAAVWRCWNLDFRGVDLLDELRSDADSLHDLITDQHVIEEVADTLIEEVL